MGLRESGGLYVSIVGLELTVIAPPPLPAVRGIVPPQPLVGVEGLVHIIVAVELKSPVPPTYARLRSSYSRAPGPPLSTILKRCVSFPSIACFGPSISPQKLVTASKLQTHLHTSNFF